MLRLRTTSTLSLLALAIGVAGTGWLCTLTSEWRPLPLVRQTILRSASSTPRHRLHAHHAERIVSAHVDARAVPITATEPALAGPAPTLRPVSMPPDDSQPWQSLRGHLDGRVLMHLRIDGHGQVSAAHVAESSGDPLLDEHALRSVRRWRFEVPPDHSEGVEGDLPMRFASSGRQLAAAP